VRICSDWRTGRRSADEVPLKEHPALVIRPVKEHLTPPKLNFFLRNILQPYSIQEKSIRSILHEVVQTPSAAPDCTSAMRSDAAQDHVTSARVIVFYSFHYRFSSGGRSGQTGICRSGSRQFPSTSFTTTRGDGHRFGFSKISKRQI
jgi:hypothetical protein